MLSFTNSLLNPTLCKTLLHKIKSVVLASDGFFPFPDIIKLCANNNVNSIIQPGGSKNDDQVIEAANKNNISVVFTGVRHFKH